MKWTQASIEEIKNPKVANITPVKVQPPKTDAANVFFFLKYWRFIYLFLIFLQGKLNII